MVGGAIGDREEVIRVEVELWLGTEKDLGEEFQILSPVRSKTEVEVPKGTSLQELLQAMAKRNPRLKELLLDPETSTLKEDLVVLKNGKLKARSALLEETLSQGDEIRLVPIYAGG